MANPVSTVADLTDEELAERGKSGELCIQCGPVKIRITSRVTGFLDVWSRCYAAFPLLPQDTIAHMRVSLERPWGLRRWYRPFVRFYVEGIPPFDPYPADNAFPLFEWGVNWCVAMTCHQYLLLHSAVLEKDGRAVILPAHPGSGKSTMCATLLSRGWRLLSDEFGIVRHADNVLLPIPRAIPLKNQSIAVMQHLAPELRYGPLFEKTRKGDVVHVFPSLGSVRDQHVPAKPALIVFPRFSRGVSLRCTEVPPAQALAQLTDNAFNYRVTGKQGFHSACSIARDCPAYRLSYGDGIEAAVEIETLMNRVAV